MSGTSPFYYFSLASQGRMVSFKNAIIILTSNLGSAEIYKESARASKPGAAGATGGKGMKVCPA